MPKQTFLPLLVVFATCASSTFAGAPHDYLERTNRMEGLRTIPTAGTDIAPLSFLAYRERLSLASSPLLRIRFFLTQPSEVHITAVELRRHGPSHYAMKPLQTSWTPGWQEFQPWPTSEVLKPLGIALHEIGVIAQVGTDKPGSGIIIPVLLYEKTYPLQGGTYTLHLLPASTLSRVDYSVVRASQKGEVVLSDRLRNLAANVPFALSFNLETENVGDYRILINSKELGKTHGPSRQFLFHHNRFFR